MNKDNFIRTPYNTPFIEQRADPYILHEGGKYYFTASVPAYDRVVLRCAQTLEGLRTAEEKEIWHCHDQGVMSKHIWAPELHRVDGQWVVYFAAGEMEDCWKIRPWALLCDGDDPMTGSWREAGMLEVQDGFTFQDFSLDMTTVVSGGRRYCVWAEKVSVGRKISNLYIAEMDGAMKLATPQMLLTSPTYAWERHNFWVNEGPAFMKKDGRIFMTYSASDTGPAYCMGLLWANEGDDLMDISVWHKANLPVMKTDEQKGIYGPGHNSFFTGEAGEIYMAYHARPYDEIIGDPLYDPNRHCFIMKIDWKDGMPVFSLDNQLYQD